MDVQLDREEKDSRFEDNVNHNELLSDEQDDSNAGLKKENLTSEEIDKIANLSTDFLYQIFSFFGEKDIKIDIYDGEKGELIFDVNGGDLGILIGRHGKTLESIQALLAAYIANHLQFYFPLIVDIEGYKSRRKDKVKSLARSAAARAKKHQGRVALPPMSAYDRKVAHLCLLEDPEVTTHSEGMEPTRRVVVTYIKQG